MTELNEDKEFSKYIHYPEKYGLGEFDSLLSIALKGIYEKFKKEKRSFESFISIGKYEIKSKANTCIQNVRVEISDNTKKTRLQYIFNRCRKIHKLYKLDFIKR